MPKTIHSAQGVCRFMVTLAMIAALTNVTWGQVTAPSVFTSSIHVQGEVLGTEFDDWATSGITIIDMDPVDNVGDIDIANIQVANDSNFVYIHATLHNASPLAMSNLFLAFDTDQNKATGWDILQVGELGSELGYQTDFPFAQHELSFNLGVSISGGPLTPPNGGALIFPFWGGVSLPPFGQEMEWAVPLDVMIDYPPFLGGPGPGFPNPSFDFVLYTDQGLGDITQVISYTLALPPVGQPGDFDGDLDVDGNDFLIWQRGNSTTSPLDPQDLSDWKTHYGAPAPLTSVTAVPEPSSMLLASLGLTALAMRRRRS